MPAPQGAIAPTNQRDYVEFTIPKEALGGDWEASKFGDEHLKFGITEITVAQTQRAGKLMGAKLDVMTSFYEQQLMCIYTIGGEHVKNMRDFKVEWMSALGPGGRQVVEGCWNKINTQPEVVVDTAVSSGESKRG